MIQFELPYAMPSLNTVLRSNRWKQSKPRIQMAWEIKLALGDKIPPAPIKRARIRYERHSSGVLDYENLVGSAKRLLDILQPASRRCPAGLGVIAGDDPQHLDAEYVAVLIRRVDPPKTVVKIEDITIPLAEPLR